ncbi:Hypothetical protein NGAL_HAMBI2427_62520 [Neorhizobium galegae bv. orientalis]|nr:Hypothetical protein NGAL_HAMBI2427_62520 [Neorhizobium galegae bv. orientalis]
MQICDFCEKEIPDHTAVCPHCHKLQMSPGEQRTHGRRIVLVAALTVLTMGSLWPISISGMASSRISDDPVLPTCRACPSPSLGNGEILLYGHGLIAAHIVDGIDQFVSVCWGTGQRHRIIHIRFHQGIVALQDGVCKPLLIEQNLTFGVRR